MSPRWTCWPSTKLTVCSSPVTWLRIVAVFSACTVPRPLRMIGTSCCCPGATTTGTAGAGGGGAGADAPASHMTRAAPAATTMKDKPDLTATCMASPSSCAGVALAMRWMTQPCPAARSAESVAGEQPALRGRVRVRVLPRGWHYRDSAARAGQRARAVAVVHQEPLPRPARRRCRRHAADRPGREAGARGGGDGLTSIRGGGRPADEPAVALREGRDGRDREN